MKIARHLTRAGLCLALVIGMALALLVLIGPLRAQSSGEHWVTTWLTSEVGRPQMPQPPVPAPPPFMANSCPAPPAPAAPPPAPPPGQTFAPQPFIQFTNQTLREIVHTSIGGSQVRVVLSNFYGTEPLTIGAAHLALRDTGAAIRGDSDRSLTFSGQASVVVPPGAVIHSDTVKLNVPDMADLAIDIYLPGTTNTPSPVTMHQAAFQTNYVSESGNHAGAGMLPVVAKVQNWFFLRSVEVMAPESASTLVLLGDSITDGQRSTPDTNHRWGDDLARRLISAPSTMRFGIANAGIAGNRVLSDAGFGIGVNALARLGHGVLDLPGVADIVVMEGINDIGQARQNPTPTAEDLIVAYKQFIERAHERGIRIYGATLTPFYGANYYTEVGEAKREAVNEWIRTSQAYDGVIDFDKVVRDPNDPKKIQAGYDACDHLHPNDAGYKAMADSIDLSLFKAASAHKDSD